MKLGDVGVEPKSLLITIFGVGLIFYIFKLYHVILNLSIHHDKILFVLKVASGIWYKSNIKLMKALENSTTTFRLSISSM